MTVLPFVLAAMALLAPGRDHTELGGAIARVVDVDRPLFEQDESRVRTAAVIVAIGFRESTFRNEVVSRTDDHCFLQVHARPDLAKDPVECVRIALGMIRASMRVCPAHPLSFYAAGPGGCTSPRAQRISRDRMWLAARLVREVSP